MRRRDFRRLASLSLRARKKSTFQTVLGISFGLILLFPLLFIAIGFYGGFNQEVNKNPSFRTFFVNYAETTRNTNSVDMAALEYKENIDNIGGISKKIDFEYVSINNNDDLHPSFILGYDKKVDMKGTKSRRYNAYGMNIIDYQYGDDPFLKGDYTYSRNPLVAGNVFSTGTASKGEIILSTNFIKEFNYEASYVIGKKFSLFNYTFPTGFSISDSESENHYNSSYGTIVEIPYLKEFTVIGVYDSEIYQKSSIRYRSQFYLNDSTMNTSPSNRDYFWITNASLGEEGEAIAPKRISHQINNDSGTFIENWYYYSDAPISLAEKVTSDGYAFIPRGIGVFHKDKYNMSFMKSEFIEFNSFGSAKSAYTTIEKYYRDSSTFEDGEVVVSGEISLPGFKQYSSFYDIFLYVCIALAALGGVIFIATLLNLLNTLHFSVQSMKGFLGICRAEGLRSKGVIRLFLNQLYLIFFYSYFSVVIFGGGACVGLKMLFDTTLKASLEKTATISFTIEWWYIPIAFGILLLTTIIISLSFSRLVAGKASKTPILDILSEENK